MKQTFLMALLLCLSIRIGWAQEVFKNEDLSITRLNEHLWVVETSDMTTMYIVEGQDKAMLIDTGTKCADLDQIVKKITQKPLLVVLTHNHPDHAGNVNYFEEAYMHPLDTVVPIGVPFKGKYHFMKEGDVFDLGNRQLEVYLMPGHTPGSIILIDKADGVCYSGDAFGSGQVWLQLVPHTPMKEYLRSCQRMENLMKEQRISQIYCGHYPFLKRTLGIDYILEMKAVAQKLADGDISEAKEYPGPKVGCDNPMIIGEGNAMIVFDPTTIK
jgi:hydroxyacylglutathione hydrolase